MSDENDPLSVCCRHLANSQHIIEEKNAEIASLRLTDEEREAIKTVVGGFGMWVAENGLTDDESLRLSVVTIRSLLERLA